MTRSIKKRRPSLFKRLLYLFMFVSGGGSIGGYVFKDHPKAQALWTLLTGRPANLAASDLDDSLAGAVAGALEPTADFRQSGIYQVTIPEVHLDPNLFKAGHTVDIQARVLKLDPRGRDQTLWETKPFGERLAVVGKDDLSAGWPHRPFQVEWHPGEQIVVEVFDHRPGLFVVPQRFLLANSDSEPRQFPLKTGTFPLEPAQRPKMTPDPRTTHIVLQSERVGDLQESQQPASLPRQKPPQTAREEAPIIIK
jgi:hypothetical protein